MKLIRDDCTADRTLGTLQHDDGTVQCQTLELPWRGNVNQISCIPAGIYECHLRYSPKHNFDLFWVDGVHGRGAIEIHAGNRVRDSLGCILLGTSRGVLDGEDAVLQSRSALAAFLTAMGSTASFTLEVVGGSDA